MASYTEHYGLHQWEAADNFLRTDFNADFAALDEAVHGCSHVTGSYVGTGSGGPGTWVTLELGFKPSLVVVLNSGLESSQCSGYFVYPADSGQGGGGKLDVEWSSTGLSWSGNDAYVMLNMDVTYHYIAFR